MKFEQEANPNKLLAAKLHEFVKYYEPRGWRKGVTIKEIDFAPYFMPDEVAELITLHKKGELKDKIDDFFNKFRKGIYKDKWYVKQAVIDFFEQSNSEK